MKNNKVSGLETVLEHTPNFHSTTGYEKRPHLRPAWYLVQKVSGEGASEKLSTWEPHTGWGAGRVEPSQVTTVGWNNSILGVKKSYLAIYKAIL